MNAGESPRREFLRTCRDVIVGLTVLGAVPPLLAGCADSITAIDPAYSGTFDVSSLSADGQSMVTAGKGADGFPLIIIRVSAETYRALSTQCPHEGCQVDPPAGSSIVCTCHDSRFDLSGNRLQGPATTALYTYSSTYDPTAHVLTVRVT